MAKRAFYLFYTQISDLLTTLHLSTRNLTQCKGLLSPLPCFSCDQVENTQLVQGEILRPILRF